VYRFMNVDDTVIFDVYESICNKTCKQSMLPVKNEYIRLAHHDVSTYRPVVEKEKYPFIYNVDNPKIFIIRITKKNSDVKFNFREF